MGEITITDGRKLIDYLLDIRIACKDNAEIKAKIDECLRIIKTEKSYVRQ